MASSNKVSADPELPLSGSSEFALSQIIRRELARLPSKATKHDRKAAGYIYREARGLTRKNETKPSKPNSDLLEKWIRGRYEKAMRREGLKPHQAVPRHDPRHDKAVQMRQYFERELGALKLLRPPVPTPPGWKGEPPDEKIKTLDQLRRYLEKHLRLIREARSTGRGALQTIVRKTAGKNAGAAYRNAWLVFDKLDVFDRPAREFKWPTAAAFEFALSELIRWLRQNSGRKQPPSEETATNRESQQVSSNDLRDEWLYNEACKGTAYKAIRTTLINSHSEWEPIVTDNGIKEAVRRYATRKGLPQPPARKAGRPPS